MEWINLLGVLAAGIAALVAAYYAMRAFGNSTRANEISEESNKIAREANDIANQARLLGRAALSLSERTAVATEIQATSTEALANLETRRFQLDRAADVRTFAPGVSNRSEGRFLEGVGESRPRRGSCPHLEVLKNDESYTGPRARSRG